MQELYKEGEKAKVKLKDEDERRQSVPMLKNQLKALVARDLWDMSEYFEIINESSRIVKKAIEVLGK